MIATVRSGSALNVTGTMTSSPSATVYVAAPKLTLTAGSSSSAILTTVSSVPPSLTLACKAPNVSLTDSPSSSTVSSVALNLNVCSVSPLVNVTSAGTPE